MSLRVARGVYNPEKDRFHYYVSFKPTLDPTEEERGAEQRHPIDVAMSVTENGDLADLAFQPCRRMRAAAGPWNISAGQPPPAWWMKEYLSPSRI